MTDRELIAELEAALDERNKRVEMLEHQKARLLKVAARWFWLYQKAKCGA